MDFIDNCETGPDLWDVALGVYITYKILVSGSDGGRKFSIRATITAALITEDESPCCPLPSPLGQGVLAGILYWPDPCEMQGARLAVGNHYDDGIVDHQPVYCQGRQMFRCSQETIFKNDFTRSAFQTAVSGYTTFMIVLVLAILCKVLLDLYLKTKSGFLLRAVGRGNDTLVHSLAKDQGKCEDSGPCHYKQAGMSLQRAALLPRKNRYLRYPWVRRAIVIGLAERYHRPASLRR
ncbi:MAG: ABC transporter permease [[Clostridium] scindens]